MTRRQDMLLDMLLVVMVAVSVVLSSRVWTDPTRYQPVQSDRPRVQAQPYVPEWKMPDIFRPERITVITGDGRGLFGGPDSTVYAQVWRTLQPLLYALRPIGAPMPVDDAAMEVWRKGPAIHLVLPHVSSLSDWAERWGWSTFGLRTEQEQRVDRISLYLGDPSGIVFEGPSGEWRMVYLAEPDLKPFAELVGSFDAPLLVRFTNLPQDKADRVTPVPAVTHLRLMELSAIQTERTAVLSRFFADLSVVRQIEEKRQNTNELDLSATSYTDGQKLVRLYDYGAIEYYAPDRAGAPSPPSLADALKLAEDFVTAHGGWPQEVMLTRWETAGNRTVLTFDLRQGVSGVPPLMTRHGFMQVAVTTDRVVYLFREPSLRWQPVGQNREIIPVTEALRILGEEKPWTRYEKVRDASLIYLVQPGQQQQVAEPYWVLQLSWGEPHFVPALAQNPSVKRILREVR